MQQAGVFESVFHSGRARSESPGKTPANSENRFHQAKNPRLVIDRADIRADPEGMMPALCQGLGLDYRARLLRWRPVRSPMTGSGRRSGNRSTGFAGAKGPLPDLPLELRRISEAALPHYAHLARCRLRPATAASPGSVPGKGSACRDDEGPSRQ